jgi:hypothetical protein
MMDNNQGGFLIAHPRCMLRQIEGAQPNASACRNQNAPAIVLINETALDVAAK